MREYMMYEKIKRYWQSRPYIGIRCNIRGSAQHPKHHFHFLYPAQRLVINRGTVMHVTTVGGGYQLQAVLLVSTTPPPALFAQISKTLCPLGPSCSPHTLWIPAFSSFPFPSYTTTYSSPKRALVPSVPDSWWTSETPSPSPFNFTFRGKFTHTKPHFILHTLRLSFSPLMLYLQTQTEPWPDHITHCFMWLMNKSCSLLVNFTHTLL